MKIGTKQELVSKCNTEKCREVRITVAMPVYNTPAFAMKRAVDSILNQTHDNLELLIVDDGSDISCRAELEGMQQRDSRVRLLCGDHLGASHARNIAIDNACGDWIAFCDADDEAQLDFLEESLAIALSCNADYVCGCMTSIYPGQQKKSGKHTDAVYIYCDQESLESAAREMLGPTKYSKFEGPHYSRGPVAKLIRKKALGGLRFNENLSLAEDVMFNYRMILNGGTLAIVDTNWYWYYQNANSSVRDSSVEFWKMAIAALLNTMMKEDEKPSYWTRSAYISQQGVENFIRCEPFREAREKSIELLEYVEGLGCFNPPVFEGYESSPWTRTMACLCRFHWYATAYYFMTLKVMVADFIKGRRGLFDMTGNELGE